MAKNLDSLSYRLAGAATVGPVDILSDALDVAADGSPDGDPHRSARPVGPEVPAHRGRRIPRGHGGRCRLLRPDGQPLTLGPGDIVFLRRGSGHTMCDPDTPHHGRSTSSRTGWTTPRRSAVHRPGTGPRPCCCAARTDRRRPPASPVRRPAGVIHLPAAPGAIRCCAQPSTSSAPNSSSPQPGSDAIVTALVDLLLSHPPVLVRRVAEGPDPRMGGSTRRPAIAPALKAIHDAPGDPWTVESLAARTGLSRAAFARRFAGPSSANRR